MNTIELSNLEDIQEVSRALGGKLRLKIIGLLKTGPRNLNEIASALDIPLSTVTVNIRQLHDAGIIRIDKQPGRRGIQKICSIAVNQFTIKLLDAEESPAGLEIIEMPVGNFVNAEISPPCGICTSEQQLGNKNDIRVFFHPEKSDAQLIWFTRGEIEYRFPNPFYGESEIDTIELSAELCSEVPYFNNKARSAIGLKVNNREFPAWESPGDFGGKRGELTPKWWGVHKTQYGLLVSWKITRDGIFLNNEKTSTMSIGDLKATETPFIRIVFYIDENSNYKGGLNLFGRKYGNHEQGIIMKLGANSS